MNAGYPPILENLENNKFIFQVLEEYLNIKYWAVGQTTGFWISKAANVWGAGVVMIWTCDYYDNQFSPVIELNLYKIWFIGHTMSNKLGITHYMFKIINMLTFLQKKVIMSFLPYKYRYTKYAIANHFLDWLVIVANQNVQNKVFSLKVP